ncbi:transport and Golgi organization protein 6 homolog [Bombina bombina]|uniref:transport and Golgi organization protein 6 homolog n=1 Tax=Bombina bombina TaxID=8345 RepID=UPI00235AB830|nr:transport and Golgi organization protein 6 homolog [Bombina bombina]
MAADLSVGVITEALSVLITPRESPETDKQAALLSSLKLNVSSLEDKLLNSPKWEKLQLLRSRILAEAKWLEECEDAPDEPTWRFTIETLLLLLCMKECMNQMAASFQPPKPNPKTPECAPALSPDTLSISQQKTVQSAIQFVVSLGICPYLLPGVGLPLQHRSEFGALVHKVVSCEHIVRTRRLYITCTTLLDVSRHPSLGSLLLTHHLGDLMAGLCQLGFCPTKAKPGQSTVGRPKDLTEGERSRCKEALKCLLDQVYQPLVIRELLILQGGPRQGPRPSGNATVEQLAPAPAWLRRLSGQLLSERLVRPHGVQAVVRGILEGAGAGTVGGRDAEAAASNWKKCEAVARVLASCPQQSLSVEDYYQKVCPQILDLLHIRDPLTARQFQRVATETFLTMSREQPQLAEKHLILPMLEPLLRCTSKQTAEPPPPGKTLVSEKELSRCMEDIVKVFVVGNDPTAALLDFTRQILSVIFSLYCFAKQNVSHLRSPCQDILLWFLEKSERELAVSTLAGLAGMNNSLPSILPYCQIKPASHGGADIIIKECNSPVDDDDALYEKVTCEQWRVECLVDLLSVTSTSGLAADFFLFCLKELNLLVAEQEPLDNDVCSGDSLLDLERRLTIGYETQEKRLQLLQVLSVLCEKISDSIFTDVQQVVEFVAVTLDRACASLPVQSQTLSMGMGLIAAMLGGAVKLTSADFGHMKRLLPILEQISQSHQELVIQELANDLRISIATHCAIQLPQRTAASSQNPERKEAQKRSPDTVDFQEILSSASDTDIPTRAAALRTLIRLLEQKDPRVLEFQGQALQLFLENLEQEDSFVYLSAIQGIAVLSAKFPDRVLPVLLAQFGNTTMDKTKIRAPENRMKVGEALMRSTRALGDVIFQYRDPLIHTFLKCSRDPDSSLRASSLSNLGELCQRLQFSLGPFVHEVNNCLSAIVRTDPEAQVRRAAIHVVVLLLRGLSEKAMEVLRDVLLDLYRLLKFVVQCESDSVSVLHAQLGLEELDHIIRAALFPPQKLEKKIVVLP